MYPSCCDVVSGKLQSLLSISTNIDSKPFRVFRVRRKLLAPRSVVLCDGSKTIIIAARAAMGNSRSRSHGHRGLRFDGEVDSERPTESMELKRPVDAFLHVL